MQQCNSCSEYKISIQATAKYYCSQFEIQGHSSQIKGQTVLCETGRQVWMRRAKRKGPFWIWPYHPHTSRAWICLNMLFPNYMLLWKLDFKHPYTHKKRLFALLFKNTDPSNIRQKDFLSFKNAHGTLPPGLWKGVRLESYG